jgi:hypothetical protein
MTITDLWKRFWPWGQPSTEIEAETSVTEDHSSLATLVQLLQENEHPEGSSNYP